MDDTTKLYRLQICHEPWLCQIWLIQHENVSQLMLRKPYAVVVVVCTKVTPM
jgi:hypothetical protein